MAVLAGILATASTANCHAAFADVTAIAGLDFRHQTSVSAARRLPEIMGSGAALFDADGDGLLDILLVADAGRIRLYRQTRTWHFTDITAASGLLAPAFAMGATLGDVDNDGDVDLLLTGADDVHLFINEGDGRFVDATAASGVTTRAAWSTAAAFCDIDDDGDLDLYIGTYVGPRARVLDADRATCTTAAGVPDYCAPSAYRSLPDLLFENDGGGRFVDISNQAGIGVAPGATLGVICADFDGDHRDDVLVANDGEHNHLWINQGANRFEQHGLELGIAVNAFGQPEASMGMALGDVDGDAQLDILMTHIDGETNTLYRALAAGGFMDATPTSGLGPPSLPFTGFGVVFIDADLDGWLDVAIANGRVRLRPGAIGVDLDAAARSGPAASAFEQRYGETNSFMMGKGAGGFRDGCAEAGDFCLTREVSRGLTAGDVDGDGDVDLLVANASGVARLFRNDAADQRVSNRHWLSVRVIDPTLKRDSIGARVLVDAGGRRHAGIALHSTSYLSSGDATVHFGLGSATRIDTVTVVWPDGKQERFPPPEVDVHRVLTRGAGSAMSSPSAR